MKKLFLILIFSLLCAVSNIIRAQNGSIDNIMWNLSDEGILSFYGRGDIPDFAEGDSPWYMYKNSILEVVLGAAITGIGEHAFSYCENLTSVTSPNIMFIGYSAFRFCINLVSVDFPNSLNTIDYEAFFGCYSLESVYVPESVTQINNAAFLNCSKLYEIDVDASNEAYTSVDGVLFNKDISTLLIYPCGKMNTHYDIPETVTFVGYNSFVNCTRINSISVPKSVTGIGSYSFLGCVNLSVIINAGTVPQKIVDNVFSNIDLKSCKLMVPAVSMNAYRNADVWKEFNDIVALETVVSIKFDREEIYLLKGSTTTFNVTVKGIIPNPDLVYRNNSAPEIAEVNYTCATGTTNPESKETQLLQACHGWIWGISKGSTVITVSVFDIEEHCTVNVIEPGNSSISGTVDNAGTSSVRVNLYVKMGEAGEKGEKGEAGETKKGIIGGYVLLATTVPNSNGEYTFEDLPEGSYKVDVEIDEYESEASPAINISDNEIRSNIDFEVNGTTGTVAPKIVTSAVETWHAASLQIYPNPFTDVVQITVETGRAPSLQMQVINTAGAIVHTQIISSPGETIHLGHLPAGMYIIRLENGKTIKAIKIQ